MSQQERVATLCREHLAGRGLAHTFNAAVIKSYLLKNGKQGNPFLVALTTADLMIDQYRPTQNETILIYEQYNP